MVTGRTALLLLLLAGSRAQSGDGDAEPRISCISDIAYQDYSLTCQLMGVANDNEDDEDNDSDRILHMTLCPVFWSVLQLRASHVKGHSQNGNKTCLESPGNTIRSRQLHPVPVWNLTVRSESREMSTTVDLKKIVRPRSPRVFNVSFHLENRQAVVYIQTPYSEQDYLTLDNQLFQLHITPGVNMVQNISSQNFLQIDMQHLREHSEYHVSVRAIPRLHFQGSWSDWSPTVTFTPPADLDQDQDQEQTAGQQEFLCMLMVCVVFVVVVTSSVLAFWKNRIFTYIWPSIPRPKRTLVQICNPNKGLLLSLNPEVFSHLKVFPLEKACREEAEPSPASCSCSNQSSDCRSTSSASTEELELSALLSRSVSSDGEGSLPGTGPPSAGPPSAGPPSAGPPGPPGPGPPSAGPPSAGPPSAGPPSAGPPGPGPSPVDVLQVEERSLSPEPGNGGHQQEEAYVTMSSFYRIK